LVPFDDSFRVSEAATSPPKGAPTSKHCRARLASAIEELCELEERLYAEDRWALLALFQAMDAAGKDGTIRATLTGINPASVEVTSFKEPTAHELDHDFLWRHVVALPERGQIGVFNRSYYEEVLVVRVHPEFLDRQKLPERPALKQLWAERYESIRDHEKHLTRNGIAIVKFWLNVSREEQRLRFLSRIEEAQKNWKFQASDIRERTFWKDYMAAYQRALRETSRPWAPWYAIPADDKDYMRMAVAEILVATLKALDPSFPKLPRAEKRDLRRLEVQLRKREV
jgi:PPK2 family polyphosphate:nucleotide phosphotransferase